jgi:hypothetical protein
LLIEDADADADANVTLRCLIVSGIAVDVAAVVGVVVIIVAAVVLGVGVGVVVVVFDVVSSCRLMVSGIASACASVGAARRRRKLFSLLRVPPFDAADDGRVREGDLPPILPPPPLPPPPPPPPDGRAGAGLRRRLRAL